MSRQNKIIAIIPARGGSKGIPDKNIIDFCGKPLLAWSILQARECLNIHAVYVSSDSPKILEVAEEYGAIGLKRPKKLATDTATSDSVLLHALDEIKKNIDKIDFLVFLQATSPLRESKDIDAAIKKIMDTQADSLFSMALLDDFCLWKHEAGCLKGFSFDPFNRGMRQDREPLFLENGSIYVLRPEVLEKNNNRLGGKIEMYEMPYWKSYEIDDLKDIEICSYYFEKHILPNSQSKKDTFQIRSNEIHLIVYDFDGVMTDNRVIVLQDGNEGIIANRADGLGVDRFREMKIPQLILSTESNPVVKARGAKLKIEVLASCEQKKDALIHYCEKKGYDLSRVVYIGNDINDLEAMRIVGYPVAPADAHVDVRSIAKFVTKAKGGHGVIKELTENIVT